MSNGKADGLGERRVARIELAGLDTEAGVATCPPNYVKKKRWCKLTKDEILKMPAGREMDERIARDVLKWSIDPGLPDECAFLYPPEWNDELQAWPSTRGRQQKDSLGLVPNYSTDMAAAWQIAEKITNDGFCPGLIFDDNGHWALSLEGAQSLAYGDEAVDVSTSFFVEKDLWCDTAPLAICRSVLLYWAEYKTE